MRILTAWSVLIIAGCASSPVSRRIVLPQSVSETGASIHWYDINGSTRAELRRDLDRLGPLDSNSARHDAYTAWFVTWHFQLMPVGAGCKISAVDTTLRIDITLPRWQPADEVEQAIIDAWRDYLVALWQHENGHRDIGAKAASEIETVLPTLPPRRSCADAEISANQTAQAVLARYQAEDRQYDAETHHGATQGATFHR
jgi:predicted secreted Zn-dependent protease